MLIEVQTTEISHGLISSSPRLQNKSNPGADGVGLVFHRMCLLRISRSKPQMSHICAWELLGAAETRAQTQGVNMSPNHGKGSCICWAWSSRWSGWKQVVPAPQTASSPKPCWSETAISSKREGDRHWRWWCLRSWRSFSKATDWNPTALLPKQGLPVPKRPRQCLP